MHICRSKAVVYVRPSFWVVLSLCLLTVPLKLVAAWLFAALFHELCHIAVLHICRIDIHGVRIGFLGAAIETEPVSNKIEFFSAIAGPAGSVVLIFLYKYFPTIAFFALVQTVSNVIPVGNRDGSRILRCLFVKCLGPIQGSKMHGFISTGVKWLVVCLFISVCILLKFVLPMMAVMLYYLLKIPCKARKQIVQYKHLKGQGNAYEQAIRKNPSCRAKTCPVYRRGI